MGAILATRGKFTEEAQLYQEALVIAEDRGHYEDIAILCANLASSAIDQGIYSRSQEHLQKGFDAASKSGDLLRIGSLLRYQGEQETDLGNYPLAEASLNQAWEIAQQSNNPQLMSSIQANYGRLMFRLKRYTQAKDHLNLGLAIAEQSGHRWHACDCLVERGEVYMMLNDLPKAEADYNRGLALAQAEEELKLSSLALFGQARITAAREDFSEACKLGRECLAALERMNHKKASIVREWLSNLPCP